MQLRMLLVCIRPATVYCGGFSRPWSKSPGGFPWWDGRDKKWYNATFGAGEYFVRIRAVACDMSRLHMCVGRV